MSDILKDESLAEKLIKKGFWLYLFSFLIAPSGYIVRVIISNELSVGEVGVLYSILGLIGLLASYNDFGQTGALNYFLPKFRINKQYDFFKTSIFFSLSVQLITGFIIASGLFFFSDWLANSYFHYKTAGTIIKIFSFYFIFINIYQVTNNVFLMLQDTFNNKFAEFIKMWGTTISVLFVFFLGIGNLTNYALCWLYGMIAGLLLSMWVFYRKFGTTLKQGNLIYDKPMLSKFIRYGILTFLGMNAGIILRQMDLQMIIFFLGSKEAGYYSNYLSLLTLYTIVSAPLLGFIFPVLNELITKKENKKFELFTSFLYKYFIVFGLSIGILLAVLGPEIALVLFGEKFITSGNLLIYGGPFLFLNIIVIINGATLGSLGKIKDNLKIVITAASFNFLANIILINTLGIIGAIISTAIGWFIMVILGFKKIKQNKDINIDYKFIGKNIITIFILGGIVLFMKVHFFNVSNDFRFDNLLYIIIFGISYYLLIVGFNYKEFLILKKEVLNIIRK